MVLKKWKMSKLFKKIPSIQEMWWHEYVWMKTCLPEVFWTPYHTHKPITRTPPSTFDASWKMTFFGAFCTFNKNFRIFGQQVLTKHSSYKSAGATHSRRLFKLWCQNISLRWCGKSCINQLRCLLILIIWYYILITVMYTAYVWTYRGGARLNRRALEVQLECWSVYRKLQKKKEFDHVFCCSQCNIHEMFLGILILAKYF